MTRNLDEAEAASRRTIIISYKQTSTDDLNVITVQLNTVNIIEMSLIRYNSYLECRTVNYNHRVKDLVQLPNTRAVRYGNNSLKFQRSMLLNTLSNRIKSAKDNIQFKNRIKKWTRSTCNCLICK